MRSGNIVWLPALCAALVATAKAEGTAEIVFNIHFEGAALGKVEVLGEHRFRCAVPGQSDEHGRNRQANWYFFRMDGVAGRAITLTLTDLVGEYDGKPGACPMDADTVPVYSDDGVHWHHFAAMTWDAARHEATLHFRPSDDRIWIAHVPPYTHSRLIQVLDRIGAARRAAGGDWQVRPGSRPAPGHGDQLRAVRRRQAGRLAPGPPACLGGRNVLRDGGSARVHHVR